jgi:hypothetical protein
MGAGSLSADVRKVERDAQQTGFVAIRSDDVP